MFSSVSLLALASYPSQLLTFNFLAILQISWLATFVLEPFHEYNCACILQLTTSHIMINTLNVKTTNPSLKNDIFNFTASFMCICPASQLAICTKYINFYFSTNRNSTHLIDLQLFLSLQPRQLARLAKFQLL